MTIQKFTKICDGISEWTGRGAGWLIWPVMGLCVYEVIMRRFFGSPHIWSYEVTNIFYGAHFMILAAYALLYHSHVSIDIVVVRFAPRTQLILSVINYVLFFFPFALVLLYVGMDSAVDSWKFGERTSIGLPFIYPIMKTLTPAAALLLLIQGLSEFAKMLCPALKEKEKRHNG
ncbi:MAG TPA: TRAP transporter small permease subunit [Thermodesulfobacteriota bacterium]|nr:TRAP transporter small permease subunit [Thermodesulfobacteriota bacterium]